MQIHCFATSYVNVLQELEQGGNPVEPWSHHLEPGVNDLVLGARFLDTLGSKMISLS